MAVSYHYPNPISSSVFSLLQKRIADDLFSSLQPDAAVGSVPAPKWGMGRRRYSSLAFITVRVGRFSPIGRDSFRGYKVVGFHSIPWFIVEYPVLKPNLGFHFDFIIFGTNSLCAFALNLAVFLLVGKTSALTMNVAGVVKDWLLIAFSWSVIKDTVTPVNLFGYGLAFLGVAYYNHLKEAPTADEEAGKLLEEIEED
ncbi:unnamed protein product [Fraxinus pennsylvanica]|uniref:Sugar phosphate transporter domain-containing protein n=1 Tax=Fraxinus pennsylvanica TaxID=56036 RepID=A0AAD1ZP29_9LAMI|nr:unnamed protein product [Fraxinus pennsylvanica]